VALSARAYFAEQTRLVDRVLERVAKSHGLLASVVRSSNEPNAVAARHEWIVLVQDSWALSSVQTARLCGVDHTTVLYAQKRRAAKRAGVPTL
jgi:chromosomal replication initiation ATPase DnaA